MAIKKLSIPNLSYRKKKDGSDVCYWIAPLKDKKYQPRTVNLTILIDKPLDLAEAIDDLNEQYFRWKTGLSKLAEFGNIKTIVNSYEADRESPYQELSAGSQNVYHHHLKWIKREIGKVAISSITGKDLKRWYNKWSNDGENRSNARCRIAVLRAVVNYGIQCRVPGCSQLLEVIRATSRYMPGGGKRELYMTADQVVALRKAAHEDGRPNLALCYALVFETTLRLFDVIKHLDWSHIDDDFILRYTPTKTEKKTGLKVTYPLKAASMVMEELSYHTIKPSGPVVLMDNTDRRYDVGYVPQLFKKHAAAAGIAPEYYARDLRPSGITEARLYGADISDLAKVAGHSSTRTTSVVYDRAVLEAATRIASVRAGQRLPVQEAAE